MPLKALDRSVLEYALHHLETRKAELDGLIANIHSQLGSSIPAPAETTPSAAPSSKKAARKKRVMSPEGKARLIAALKKRWAAHHKAQAATETAAVTKKAVAKKATKTTAKKATKKAAKKTGKKRDNSDVPF